MAVQFPESGSYVRLVHGWVRGGVRGDSKGYFVRSRDLNPELVKAGVWGDDWAYVLDLLPGSFFFLWDQVKAYPGTYGGALVASKLFDSIPHTWVYRDDTDATIEVLSPPTRTARRRGRRHRNRVPV